MQQREQALVEKTSRIMKNAKKMIWVTFRKEGIHRYPAATSDPKLATNDEYDVSFLGYPHRHIFHFNVAIQVFHDDRDIEITVSEDGENGATTQYDTHKPYQSLAI